MFAIAIHHNYPPLCEEMDDIVSIGESICSSSSFFFQSTASDYLSVTDLLTSKWTESQVIDFLLFLVI